MNIYLCDTPIKFPASEYGGTIAVIAKNQKQLEEILTEHYRNSYFDLSISIRSVKEFALDPDKNYEEGIVHEFLT